MEESTIFAVSHLVLPMVFFPKGHRYEDGLNDTFHYLDNITFAGKDQDEHDTNVQRFLQAVQSRNLSLNQSKTVKFVYSINILGYCVGNGTIKPNPE